MGIKKYNKSWHSVFIKALSRVLFVSRFLPLKKASTLLAKSTVAPIFLAEAQRGASLSTVVGNIFST